MKFYFIINSRKDKAVAMEEILRQLEKIKEEEQLRGNSIETYKTTGEGDATRFVRLYCDLHQNEKVCFVACGGDGTTNEVASGIVGFPNKSMAVLAVKGSTNDFTKTFPDRDFTSIPKIFDGDDKQIDIIKINDSYAINDCDFGFDSTVASVANEMTSRGHKNGFHIGILKAIFTARYNRIKVVADGKRIGGKFLLLCALANGQYVGGEFRCAPKAKVDDGLIDICYVRPMLLLRFFLIIPSYRRGEHLNKKNRKFIYTQAKHIEISSKQMIELCLDGELLPGTKFNIDILPQAVTLRFPRSKE